MPQPPCKSRNEACRVSNTGSCNYVIPPTCPPLMPPLLHWQQIASMGEQPGHQPPPSPPPPTQRRGWHVALPASSAGDNQVQQWNAVPAVQGHGKFSFCSAAADVILSLCRASPWCHFSTAPQFLAPSHPWLLPHWSFLI